MIFMSGLRLTGGKSVVQAPHTTVHATNGIHTYGLTCR